MWYNWEFFYFQTQRCQASKQAMFSKYSPLRRQNRATRWRLFPWFSCGLVGLWKILSQNANKTKNTKASLWSVSKTLSWGGGQKSEYSGTWSAFLFIYLFIKYEAGVGLCLIKNLHEMLQDRPWMFSVTLSGGIYAVWDMRRQKASSQDGQLLLYFIDRQFCSTWSIQSSLEGE